VSELSHPINRELYLCLIPSSPLNARQILHTIAEPLYPASVIVSRGGEIGGAIFTSFQTAFTSILQLEGMI